MKWNVKAVTITGMTVKRLKKEVVFFNSGSILGLTVSPFIIASIAITEHIPTNTIARITAIAELNHKDSAITHHKNTNY